MAAAQRVVSVGRAGIRGLCGKAAPSSGPKGYRVGDLVPSLAGLIPALPACKSIKSSEVPWVTKTEAFFETWQKVTPCMPKYEEFLKSHATGVAGVGFVEHMRAMRTQMNGRVMSDESQAALAEFYLAVALRLRPTEIDAASSDGQALLQVARKCAEEDFEPCVQQAQELIADYDAGLHKALEETCPLYEVDDDLFWRANFDVAAPAEFQHFLTALGHGSGQGWTSVKGHTSFKDVGKTVAEAREALLGNEPAFEPARRAAEMVYSKWLDASSMPVKATIAKALMQHGLMVAIDIYQDDKLLPESADIASMMPNPLNASMSA